MARAEPTGGLPFKFKHKACREQRARAALRRRQSGGHARWPCDTRAAGPNPICSCAFRAPRLEVRVEFRWPDSSIGRPPACLLCAPPISLFASVCRRPRVDLARATFSRPTRQIRSPIRIPSTQIESASCRDLRVPLERAARAAGSKRGAHQLCTSGAAFVAPNDDIGPCGLRGGIVFGSSQRRRNKWRPLIERRRWQTNARRRKTMGAAALPARRRIFSRTRPGASSRQLFLAPGAGRRRPVRAPGARAGGQTNKQTSGAANKRSHFRHRRRLIAARRAANRRARLRQQKSGEAFDQTNRSGRSFAVICCPSREQASAVGRRWPTASRTSCPASDVLIALRNSAQVEATMQTGCRRATFDGAD